MGTNAKQGSWSCRCDVAALSLSHALPSHALPTHKNDHPGTLQPYDAAMHADERSGPSSVEQREEWSAPPSRAHKAARCFAAADPNPPSAQHSLSSAFSPHSFRPRTHAHAMSLASGSGAGSGPRGGDTSAATPRALNDEDTEEIQELQADTRTLQKTIRALNKEIDGLDAQDARDAPVAAALLSKKIKRLELQIRQQQNRIWIAELQPDNVALQQQLAALQQQLAELQHKENVLLDEQRQQQQPGGAGVMGAVSVSSATASNGQSAQDSNRHA